MFIFDNSYLILRCHIWIVLFCRVAHALWIQRVPLHIHASKDVGKRVIATHTALLVLRRRYLRTLGMQLLGDLLTDRRRIHPVPVLIPIVRPNLRIPQLGLDVLHLVQRVLDVRDLLDSDRLLELLLHLVRCQVLLQGAHAAVFALFEIYFWWWLWGCWVFLQQALFRFGVEDRTEKSLAWSSGLAAVSDEGFLVVIFLLVIEAFLVRFNYLWASSNFERLIELLQLCVKDIVKVPDGIDTGDHLRSE